ncbi:MAG: dihydroorotate dehydrogenase electron transfer subunit [Lachnospiraceae bacterium]|nr:dihydroorotate dehydrogenase electron transfer subunit [Lachnospiraceae bacterium]
MKKEELKVMSQVPLAEGIYSMWLHAPEMAAQAKPGQFINFYTGNAANLLPRPISICEIDRERGALRVVYRVVGKGTAEFSRLQAGDGIRAIGPLGNGYFLKKDRNALLIGGGIGIPPLVALAKSLKKENPNIHITIAVGYRNKEQTFLINELAACGKLIIASDDGSIGTKGTVIDALREQEVANEEAGNGATESKSVDDVTKEELRASEECPEAGNGRDDCGACVIYSCGPMPMLRAVKEYGLSRGMETQISMEERMACGVGACLGCVCKTTETDEHSQVKNRRVCKDGPVFYAEEIEL